MADMKALAKKNSVLFAGLALAALSLLASWGLQQVGGLEMDTMDSLALSGGFSALSVVAVTLVGLALASRQE